ncbi:hypothetical protein [Nocardia sp. NPDC051833]|uniref:hypothetical protein n=1 Tax=Nocardia sp. NPDC051833 TaxID=3155674 RepID=UPI00341C4093
MAAAIGGLCTTGLMIGAIGATISDGGSDRTPTSGLTAAATRPPSVTTSAVARYDVSSPDNLAAELTVIEKKCFGSAGCNFKYELRVVTAQGVAFDPSTTYRASIVIDGGTNWERIHSLEVRGSKADVVSGSVSKDTLTTPAAVIETVTARP